MGVECVTVSNDVFMEGKDRECSVAGLVLYCMRVCKLVFGVECVTVSNVVFMEGRDKECCVACLVLYCVTVFILVCVWVCYGRQC